MKEPVDHVLRPSLPWRESEDSITECGFNAANVKTLSRPELFARRKELGLQRTSMTTCMTCMNTAERHGTWSEDPRPALLREIIWEYGDGFRARSDRGDRLKNELLAIAQIIESHRDEFDAAVLALEKQKEWIDKKRDHRARLANKNINANGKAL